VPTIEATFSDLHTIRVERPDVVWFLRGVRSADRAAIDRLVDGGDGESFCRVHGDALVVRIDTGARPTVTVWRSLFSSHELFWSIRPTGDVVLADLYRNMMAALPIAERATSDLTVTSHYLSRKPYCPLTMSASVLRTGFATRIDIDLPTGAVASTRFDSVSSAVEARPPNEYLEAVEHALVSSLDEIDDPSSTALMFSGGVDSTLVLALDPSAMRPVSFVPETPEFLPETEYARCAAGLVGVDLEEIPVAENLFVGLLERATDVSAIPLYDDSSPYFQHVFENTDYTTFVFGLGADSAFGQSLKLARVSNAMRFTPIRQALSALAPRTSGHLGYRVGQVASRAEGFARDPWDPDGWAGNTRSAGDIGLLEHLMGPELPREARDRQLAEVRELVDDVGANRSTFLSHIEISHWMVVFGGTLYESKLSTNAFGKRSVGPYGDWRVLNELSRVPLEERYVNGLRAKWMLKNLLKQKVPGYPVDQRKKATALPWQRFYTHGPLTGIWERYPIPNLFTGEVRRRVVEDPTLTTWNAITHSVWEERVRKNPNLTPMGVVESVSLPFRRG
jgi:asparagine synthetase B (glutamine-hydrolysing)